MNRKNAEEVVSNVVEQLKEIRKERNLSHEKLADLAKLNRSTISLIESGKRQPTLLTCIRIANAMKIDLADLLKSAK